MSPAQCRHRTSNLRLSEDVHDRYKEVVQVCEHCAKNPPPLQRSKVSGLRADNFGDIVFIDYADVTIRSETYTKSIVFDGATTFVTAFAPRAKDSHETVQCLMEFMDTFHCTPHSICADMAFQSTEVQDFFGRFGIKALFFARVLTHHCRIEQKQQFVCSSLLCTISVLRLEPYQN